MSNSINIEQAGNLVKVTKSGELVVGQVSYDESEYRGLATPGDAYNFFKPLSGKQFVMTGFIAVSDKNITADAILEIYEANSTSSTTPLKETVTVALTKNAVVSPTPLRSLISKGVWLNAKTDDATIHLTIFGYYINEA